MRLPAGAIILTAAIALLFWSFGSGCSEQVNSRTGNGADDLSTPPGRVVSMSPNLTQIVYALGSEEKLVGVDAYSTYPPEAESLPSMGNFLDPDLEALVASQPDLVLLVDTDEQLIGLLSRLGLEYVALGNDTVAEILHSIERLGVLLDREERAREIIERFDSVREEIDEALKSDSTTRVALVVGRNLGVLQDIYVVGSASFLGELIEMAGGVNVFGEQALPYPQVGAESIVGADPDVIIDSTLSKGASAEQLEELRSDWDSLPSLRAVKEGRVIVPDEGWFQVPGAYLDSTLRLFAHWLHPDVFPDEVTDPNLTSGD